MPAWWGNVDPALLQHLPVSDMHCPQWPRPRQDLRQPSLFAHMDGDQDRGREITREVADDLYQRLHAARRSTNGEHHSMISFGLDPRSSHELYRGGCGHVCVVIFTREISNPLRRWWNACWQGNTPPAASRTFLGEIRVALAADSAWTKPVVECR